MRKEKDTMGTVDVPADAYYGAQTQRAVNNFTVSNYRIPNEMVRALAIIKRAAANVNSKLGLLDGSISSAIVEAADEVIDGKMDSQFPVDVFQTGSGTSTNMNMNEVISNRANEILGHGIGKKDPVHPNDHVNMGQSSNDIIPSAIHLSSVLQLDALLSSLDRMYKALRKKEDSFADIIKIGRTHLQDATPITLGQEFSGYAQMIKKSIERVRSAGADLHSLAQGGTAVGTGINTHQDFGKLIAKELSSYLSVEINEAENHFEAQSSQDSVVQLSGALKTLSVSLSKIANDIRWLGSGPRAGLGELRIPPVQPGSSIMPGKVNPVICESLIQVSARAIGNDLTITMCGSGSVFELNLMLPLIGFTILESIQILTNGVDMFCDKLLDGLGADADVCRDSVEKSLAMCTSLVPVIGYDKAAEIAYKAYESDMTIREVVLDQGILSEEDADRYLNPESMLGHRKS